MVDRTWGEIIRLSELKHFKDFDKYFCKNIDRWREIYDSSTPHQEDFPFVFSPSVRGSI